MRAHRAHEGERQRLADGRAREHHEDAVHPEAKPAGGRQPELQRGEERLVELHRLRVERRTPRLVLEPCALVDGVVTEFAVSPPDARLKLRELSGGNQQKVIVGKWLGRGPKLLILDDPTIGVDPGARRTMFNVIAERCRTENLCVLLLSSEPEELAAHCHRVIAIEDGTIAAEFEGERLDRLTVSAWASK